MSDTCSINILFLDIDGVVNTPMWVEQSGKLVCKYNFPKHGKVNNWQACQWLSRFCKERGYSIVVTSTWREDGLKTCRECLYSGGVWKSIPIIGMTPILHIERGYEIESWLSGQLSNGMRIKRYLILDDEDGTVSKEQSDRLVLCRGDVGFGLYDMKLAEELHDKQKYTRL